MLACFVRHKVSLGRQPQGLGYHKEKESIAVGDVRGVGGHEPGVIFMTYSLEDDGVYSWRLKPFLGAGTDNCVPNVGEKSSDMLVVGPTLKFEGKKSKCAESGLGVCEKY